jgi:hypothetical protein
LYRRCGKVETNRRYRIGSFEKFAWYRSLK